MVAIAVVGIATMPMLNIQYKPSSGNRSVKVSYSCPGASAEIVEAEATSVIEGVLSGMENSVGISSVSKKGSGSVTVKFGKGTDMAAARFEVAAAVRNIYPSLPEDVTYPSISIDIGGNRNSVAISYLIKGGLPSQELVKYAENHMLYPLSSIPGVDKVSIYGGSPFEWVITYDSDKAMKAGISPEDIAEAFSETYSDEVLGMIQTDGGHLAARMSCLSSDDFGSIPVKAHNGRIIRLGDIATWKFQESVPKSYYRVNGLNTVTLSVGVSNSDNLLVVAGAVKKEMAMLSEAFPEGISATLAYDSSEYVSSELNRIYLRTGLCLLILLLFVFVIYRSWKYLFVVFSTLTVNILMALAIYNIFGIRIHIYTLAGITVSLGIIIDTTIVMADHYRTNHDRGAFPSLVSAIGTTVAALLMTLLLPESERANLTDFIYVIIVNLLISLVVAWFFVPSLMDRLPMPASGLSLRRKRFYARAVSLYGRYIGWGLDHRWILVSAAVAAFGIPLCVLPDADDMEKKEDKTWIGRCVEKVVSWTPYESNRKKIDKMLGSSFGLFYRSLDKSDFYREPEKKVLSIKAGMPEGCTVSQLNEVVKAMENYLSQFDEIATFTTNVTSYDNARITVEFKPEYESSPFPSALKARVTQMAMNFGGATWSIYGVDDNYFSNNITSSGFKGGGIVLSGYNFRELCRYAEVLIDYLSENKRVSEPELRSGEGGVPSTEFNLKYDYGRMASLGISPYSYYVELYDRLFEQELDPVIVDGTQADVVLKSSSLNTYDLWHLRNSPVSVDSVAVVLSDVGSIEKRRTGIDITRQDQIYKVIVAYDFIGSRELSEKVMDEAMDYMNSEVLPVGFKASPREYSWFQEHKDKYAWLLLLMTAVIYVMLSIGFNSVRFPLSVIMLIPLSFIGFFLTFGLSELVFDQGGFAALVMLCGIVVNAGIYLIYTYMSVSGGNVRLSRERSVRCYLKAFKRKVTPVSLTIISSILGLLPFLTDGPEEVFWFNFAIGTIGGLLFSVIVLLLYFPVFVVRRR